MAPSMRDWAILQVLLAGLRAWDPTTGPEGLTGAADISRLSEAEIDRGEQLLNALSEKAVAAALAAVDADISKAARPRRPRRSTKASASMVSSLEAMLVALPRPDGLDDPGPPELVETLMPAPCCLDCALAAAGAS